MSLFQRHQSHHQEAAVHQVQDAASAKDPVCGMTVDPSSAAATREVDGKRYYFCSTHCAATFDKNPAAFIA